MSLIVDASVAVKWVVDEQDSSAALALINENEALLAPTLLLAEVGNALWKSFRRGTIPKSQADGALATMPMYFERLYELRDLILPAGDLALRFDHPFYDCVYLALARQENMSLVTADERLYAAARKAKVKARRL